VAAFHAAKVVEAGWVADLAVALADCEVVLADRNNSTNRVWTALTTRSAWLEVRIIAIQASPESRSDRRGNCRSPFDHALWTTFLDMTGRVPRLVATGTY